MLSTAGKGLPDVCTDLNHFKDAFDWVEANNSGRIIPHKGVDTEYDLACKAVKEIESSLLEHLKEQRILLGGTSVRFLLKQLEFNILYCIKSNIECSYLSISDYLCQCWKGYIPIGSARKFV